MISRQPWLAVLIAVASAMSVVACMQQCPDVDSDGFSRPAVGADYCKPGKDCDDDPTDDPPACDTCTCGEAGCSACARCINPGAQEAPSGDPICADGLDNDCDELIDECKEPCASPEECDDGNPCTDDDCVDSICAHTDNDLLCDDGDRCTMNDACSQGVCGGDPLDADGDTYVPDSCGGNDCDDDPDDDPPVCYTCTCGEAGCSACARCINPDAQEGPLGDPTCADGLDNDCDELTDSEDNGCRQCASADECDDGNPCTDDACVSFLCEYPYNEDPCDDGDPCTTNDACSQGVCGGELPDADGDTYVPDSCGGNDCDDDDGDDPPTCLTCSCGEAECAACARCINPGLEEGPRAEPPCRDCVDNDCDGSPDGADSGCAPESPYDGAFAVNYTLNWHNCYPMPLLDESVEITVQEATILISVDDPCLTASGTWNEANSQGSGTSPWSCQTPGPPPGCEPCQKMTLNITFTDTDNFNGTCLFDAIFDPYCGQSLCIAEYTVTGVRSSP